MRQIDTREYISALRELTEEGKEVCITITGNSMSPFLAHQRDQVCFRKPDRELHCGDMVFYQRQSGQFVMHRICKVCPDGFALIGDAQQEIEYHVSGDQIFAVVTRVKRKGKWIHKGNFWWEFFAHIWIRIIPFRYFLIRMYALICKRKV